ncbi:tRNA (N(6)-L-threonylcarbamoyladenosine(37)-C(2))-methylthiotransferase MtaB [candidate division TA06 bacterium]|uniref:tRNA (N(6)-L-threonylcarbamoyladenosine(37)-C(2))-methylthiotransferase MtaB n=1 Tax=candidate division TA06 bacterium TaxID=2250710 RepID=A0A933I933_UNCT6|nr:tRNA (N(6)-L-threonylcarbamoyladenosine(37)-C(2))-methylthiotransferase MtaB [candidate division TA06 bacterium]
MLTQLWRAALEQAGLFGSGPNRPTDFVLINTCTVTSAADQQARQTIRKIKKQNQKTKIVVAGCYGQINEKALKNLPQADLVVGRCNQDSVSLVCREFGLTGESIPESIKSFSGRTRAFLKVQDGCDHRCSYCIVPLARGKSCSRELSSIMVEAGRLVGSGHKELVITGVRLGDFKPSLRVLLKSIHDLPGLERIRLSSLEPDDASDDLIETLAELPKVARHLHLPLQSGDNKILKLMDRLYTVEYFSSLLSKIKKAIPEMTFGTDIIVGFPGEGEQEFGQSYNAVKDLPLSHLHIFTYSKRPQTKAAEMPRQIPEGIKKERSQRLRAMFVQKQQRYWGSQAGQTTAVLFEQGKKGRWSGLGEHYFRVTVSSGLDLKNKMMPIKLTTVNEQGLDGQLAD